MIAPHRSTAPCFALRIQFPLEPRPWGESPAEEAPKRKNAALVGSNETFQATK